MRVRKRIAAELKKLIDEESPQSSILLRDFLSSHTEHITSTDEKELLLMIVYNLALSRLWSAYSKENPNPNLMCLNEVILTYMTNLWGQLTIKEFLDNTKEFAND